MNSLNRINVSRDLFNAFLNGKNSYLRLTRSESSHFDPSWIKVIEDCLYDLGEIVNNPRQVTKIQSDVVPVELAKKINGESVTHLASHTQYIKDIADNGDVVPSKILSHFNEDDIHTYENRFIATFIRRLVLFIQKRYDFVLKTIPDYVDEVMIIKNTSYINGQTVEIETKIRVKKESDDDVSIAAKAYAERIKTMMEYVVYYYNSPFMRQMKTEKDVRKPILQTNIIRKNPKYRKCYETFTFIEKYDSLGVTYKVDEKYTNFTQKDREEINNLFFSSYLAMKDTTNFNKIKTNNKVYKPRIRSSIDDEHFVFGELLRGPIEFVRVDEEYRKYLQSQIRTDLPQHPTKVEKEYYADDYQRNRDIKAELKEIERLLARKQREIAKFEKQIAKIIAQREKEEAELERLLLLAKEEEEQRRIELKRQEIIAAAKQKEEEIRELLRKEQEELERLKALQALEEVAKEVSEEQPEEAPIEEEQLPEDESAPIDEAPVEEQPTEESVVEEPQEEPSEPVEEVSEEPVVEQVEEQPVEEIPSEEPNNEPVVEEAPAEEPQEEPQPETKKEKKARKPRAKKQKVEETPAEPQEETPVVEEQPSEPVEEPQPVEESPVEEPIVEEEPAPVKEKKPRKPRAKKQKVEEPQPEPEPVEETPAVEEEPVVEEQPVKEKKPRKPRAKKEKTVETPIEETPAVEETPVEEPAPAVEEAPVESEPVLSESEAPAPVKEKKPRKPRKKKEPVKEEKPVEEKPRVRRDKKPEILDVIPGKFIVKAYEGYYINDKKFSVYKRDAKIFDDFNKAKVIKARFGGKVIKL